MGAVADIQDAENCRAVAWGDYDNDGHLDVHLTAGHARPAWLFHSDGDGTFTNVYDTAGMGGIEREAYGAAWADYDNDGFLDLAICNATGAPYLFHNNGSGSFADDADAEGMNAERQYRVNCWADFDLDGRIDLFAGANDNYSCLYQNTGLVGNYLRVRALTDSDGDTSDANTAEDRDALGARVEVNLSNDATFLSGTTLLRVIDGGSSFCGQGEPVAHFGLGSTTLVAVRVTYPDGRVVTRSGVSANQQIEVRDPSPPILSSGYVTPSSGGTTARFTWRVKYWNTNNAAPDEIWVAIWWGSRGEAFWYPMWAYDPADTYYKDGKWYTVSMRWLDSSAHAYRFAARQGTHWAYWPKPAGSYRSGPDVGG